MTAGTLRRASKAERKVLERLLVECSGNDPRKVVEGSLALHGMDPFVEMVWTERTKRGLVARSGLVHGRDLFALVIESFRPERGAE